MGSGSVAIHPESVNATKKSHAARSSFVTLLVLPYLRVGRIEAKQFLDSDALVIRHFTNGPKDSHHVFSANIDAPLSPPGKLPTARRSPVEFFLQLLLNTGGWHSTSVQPFLQQGW